MRENNNSWEKELNKISVIMCGGKFKLSTDEYNSLHELLEDVEQQARADERKKIIEEIEKYIDGFHVTINDKQNPELLDAKDAAEEILRFIKGCLRANLHNKLNN